MDERKLHRASISTPWFLLVVTVSAKIAPEKRKRLKKDIPFELSELGKIKDRNLISLEIGLRNLVRETLNQAYVRL